jgi:hypothetical protein
MNAGGALESWQYWGHPGRHVMQATALGVYLEALFINPMYLQEDYTPLGWRARRIVFAEIETSGAGQNLRKICKQGELHSHLPA